MVVGKLGVDAPSGAQELATSYGKSVTNGANAKVMTGVAVAKK